MSLNSAMSMQKKNAKIALQDSTAAAAARQIPIISTDPSQTLTTLAVRCRKNESNVQ